MASEKRGQFVHYSLVHENLIGVMYDFPADFCPVSRVFKKESVAIAARKRKRS